jgi:hypothetical protein
VNADDARFAITQMSTWIANADVKAGLIATADTVLVGALISQRREAVDSARQLEVADVIGLISLGLSAIGVIWSAFFLLIVLTPRVRSGQKTRYSWPSLAQAKVSDLVDIDLETDRREAWTSAIALANIAARKYRATRLSLIGWIVGGVFLLVWWGCSL